MFEVPTVREHIAPIEGMGRVLVGSLLRLRGLGLIGNRSLHQEHQSNTNLCKPGS